MSIKPQQGQQWGPMYPEPPIVKASVPEVPMPTNSNNYLQEKIILLETEINILSNNWNESTLELERLHAENAKMKIIIDHYREWDIFID